MPAFQCEESIVVESDLERVRSEVADFTRWPLWSPWLYVEPEASIEYAGKPGEIAHGYHWTGQKTGEGQMSIKALDTRSIEADLTFIKPFRSKAEVAFEFEALEKERTRVLWSMRSQLPWFMFFMKASMVAMISSDYRRGLLMLKDLIESGSVPSETATDGVTDMPAISYFGQRKSSSLAQIGGTIEAGLTDVSEALASAGADASGSPFVHYESMDIKNGHCVAVMAVPTDDSVQITGDFIKGTRASGKTLKFTHKGAYRHLGNAWHQAMGEMKSRKLKAASNAPPFEIYLTDPDQS